MALTLAPWPWPDVFGFFEPGALWAAVATDLDPTVVVVSPTGLTCTASVGLVVPTLIGGQQTVAVTGQSVTLVSDSAVLPQITGARLVSLSGNALALSLTSAPVRPLPPLRTTLSGPTHAWWKVRLPRRPSRRGVLVSPHEREVPTPEPGTGTSVAVSGFHLAFEVAWVVEQPLTSISSSTSMARPWWVLHQRPWVPSQRLQFAPLTQFTPIPVLGLPIELQLDSVTIEGASQQIVPVTGHNLSSTVGTVLTRTGSVFGVVLATGLGTVTVERTGQASPTVPVTGISVSVQRRTVTVLTSSIATVSGRTLDATLGTVTTLGVASRTVLPTGTLLTATAGVIGSQTTGRALVMADASLHATASVVRALGRATLTAGAQCSATLNARRVAEAQLRTRSTVSAIGYRQGRGAVTLQGGATLQVVVVRPDRVDSLYGPFQADQVFGGE